MFKIVIILFAVKVVTNGVPLEPPTANFAKFFTNRIVGGSDAPDGSAPYMAAIVHGNPRMLMCGSFIISTKVVLTAAHCIDPFVQWWDGELLPSLRIIVGSNVWKKDSGVAYEVQSYKNHPEWDPWFLKYDAGVFFLKTDIVLNDRTNVLPLSFDVVKGREKAYVNGWGLTEAWVSDTPKYLQLLHLWTMSHQDCVNGIREVLGDWGWSPPVFEDAEICTFHSYGHGLCNGDSGSPLVLASGDKPVAIGIVSWGFPCAVGAPDVYTRISGLKDFLEPIMETYNTTS